MNDATQIEEVDYLKVKLEFDNTSDYRNFILQYNHINNIDVQFLVIKAHWLLVISENDQIEKELALKSFIRNYCTSDDMRIRKLVAHCMFLQLKSLAEQSDKELIIEYCNQLIEYILSIEVLDALEYEALVFSYWHKAEYVKHRDWRKSEYFYKKVIGYTKPIKENLTYLQYKLKAKAGIVDLHLHYSQLERAEKMLYSILHGCFKHKDMLILVDRMIDRYLTYLVDKKIWFSDNRQVKEFTEFLMNHAELQKLILKSKHSERSIARLIWIADAYRRSAHQVLFEQYLLKFFSFFTSWQDVRANIIKYLQFLNREEQENFLSYAEELHHRYKNLEKYRKLFKIDKSKK